MPRNAVEIAEAWSCSKQYTFLTNLPACTLLCFIPDPRSDGKFNITAAANDARRYIRNVCTKSDRSAFCRYIGREAIRLQFRCEIIIVATATFSHLCPSQQLLIYLEFGLKIVEAKTLIIK